MHTLDQEKDFRTQMDTSASLEGLGGFEGPEKRLEVDFKKNPDRPLGLRALSREQWQELLNFAKCTIISQTSNEHFDAYVLSESSLFVYPFKMMLKTCGTTTLLRALPQLMAYAASLDLTVELVMYSRKNFLFPEAQQSPHLHWNQEVDYLNKMFDGTAYVLGPITQEHWYLYLADYSDPESVLNKSPEVTLEVMMHKLDRDCARQFHKDRAEAATIGSDEEGLEPMDGVKTPRIADLLPGSEIDEFYFDPCGYSMNGLLQDSYWTIHVTPEPHCSYASFETNCSLASFKKLITKVVSIFRPGSITLTLFCENSPHIRQAFDVNIPGFVLQHKTFAELDGNADITMCNYRAMEYPRPQKKAPCVPPDRVFVD